MESGEAEAAAFVPLANVATESAVVHKLSQSNGLAAESEAADTPEDAAILAAVQEDAVGEASFHLRWRVRGWRGLKSYLRGEWLGEGQEVFVLVERDVGERWSDYTSFYYKHELAQGELVVGDLRPGFGVGLVFGRGRGGGLPARASARDSRRLRLDLERGNWTLQAQGLRLFIADRRDEWERALALRWRLRQAWGSATLHGSQFHTHSYASRLYEYDVPGTVSVRPLYGEGWRLYGLVSLRWQDLDLSVRYRLQRDRRTRQDVALQIERSVRR